MQQQTATEAQQFGPKQATQAQARYLLDLVWHSHIVIIPVYELFSQRAPKSFFIHEVDWLRGRLTKGLASAVIAEIDKLNPDNDKLLKMLTPYL